jgi:serine/threonine protein kinase
MHRDIKPENILFRTKNYKSEDVCLVDFGLSTLVEEKQYLFFRCGTPGYVAPEVINLKDEKGKYSQVCDVFSVGVIFHIL